MLEMIATNELRNSGLTERHLKRTVKEESNVCALPTPCSYSKALNFPVDIGIFILLVRRMRRLICLCDRILQDAKDVTSSNWRSQRCERTICSSFYVKETVVGREMAHHVAIILSKPPKQHGCMVLLVNSIITWISCVHKIFNSFRQMTSISFLAFFFFFFSRSWWDWINCIDVYSQK